MDSLQEQITHGWQVSAEGYSKRVVVNDFELPGRQVWTSAILCKAPKEGVMDILDVGTGPGVFATILSMAGHRVTGIDISSNMLEQARMNSARMGVSPKYLLMNSQELTFPDNSFDMIVSRYVVWTIEKPELAYASWLRCLKPGGRIIVFDACNERETISGEERQKEFFEKFGEMPPVSFKNYEEARGFGRELKLRNELRPEWDAATMKRLGYTNIHWENVAEEVSYDERQAIINKGKYFFRLCGDKPIESQSCSEAAPAL